MFQEELTRILKESAVAHNADLVDYELEGKGSQTVLRVFIDKSGGVDLDTCTKISRSIADLLDRKDLFSDNYRLEVSSPGLDRPLKEKCDYERQLERLLKVTYSQDDKDITITGRLQNVTEDSIYLLAEEKPIRLPFQRIKKAKVEIEF
ncbi:ribosome maturation factor [candidate division KSB1 bacterium]|nr:ribosome maturation factor [candidate division KSB1 bacterium]